MTRIHLSKRALAAIVAAVTLAGCGASSSTPSAGSAQSNGSAPPAATSSGAIENTATPTKSAVSAPIDGSGSFCTFARAAEKQIDSDTSQIAADTPEQLKAFETKELEELKLFVAKAPAQIKGAISVIAQTDEQIYSKLQQSGFDFTKVGADFATTINTPAFQQATTDVTTYLSKNCGITEPSPADS